MVAVWLSRPRAAGEGHQARKHGYGDVLPELGLATASQQASADLVIVHSISFYVVSQLLYAGTPNFRARSTSWVVFTLFTG